MKDSKEQTKDTSRHAKPEFNGYTIEELRYQLALTALKKEYLKERAMECTDTLKKQLPFTGGKSSVGFPSKGIFSKLMKGLDLVDYIMIGYQGFRIMKKLGSVIKKRK